MNKNKKTNILTNEEMINLYFACKKLLDLIWEKRKSNGLIFEELDIQTIGDFCTALSENSKQCSKFLARLQNQLSKYDIIFHTNKGKI